MTEPEFTNHPEEFKHYEIEVGLVESQMISHIAKLLHVCDEEVINRAISMWLQNDWLRMQSLYSNARHTIKAADKLYGKRNDSD